MRIHIHDFSGHPFQVQLSRALARRGHQVEHAYSTQFVTGQGRLSRSDDDPPGLTIRGVTCSAPMVKYSPWGRIRFELSYARAWRKLIEKGGFDVVVACNVPMFALARMARYFAVKRQPWILWHQDLYSLGVGAEIARTLPSLLTPLAQRLVERVEKAQVNAASQVVAITHAMVAQYDRWNAHYAAKTQIVANWAPIDEIKPGPRENPWAEEHAVSRTSLRIVYAGTLGRKHNPQLLLEILDAARSRGTDATLIVASEGQAASDLALTAQHRDDVRFVGFQPMDRFPDLLASADVVVVLLEHDAARFSVPSKVLSYFAAGKAVVALVPSDNPAAVDVRDTGGFVGPPDFAGAHAAGSWLSSSTPADLAEIGRASREFAEQNFDVDAKVSEFETVFTAALTGR